MVASADEVKTMQTLPQTNGKGLPTKTANGTGLGQSHLRRRDAMKVQHYDIDFAIVGRQLEMPPTQSGEYATNMRFGLAAYTEDGELLNGMEVSVKNAIPAAQYQKIRSEEHTSELQSLRHLVCRLL